MRQTRVIGVHVIEVAFQQSMASQLILFADVLVIPAHIDSKGDFNADFNDLAVGSGPYKMISHTLGKEIVIERRDDDWRDEPCTQTVVFKVITDHRTAWNARKESSGP